MTLILTLVRPGEGIWQSVDCRLTMNGKPIDDFAAKQVLVAADDGSLLIAFTGAAQVMKPRESTFDWLRSTLRGVRRPVFGHLQHLAERANRDLIGKWSTGPLTFIAAYLCNPPHAVAGQSGIVEMSNHTGPGGGYSTRSSFPPALERAPFPQAWAYGSGGYTLDEYGKHLMARAVEFRPKRPGDYQGLLETVNRRSATRSGGLVSPWCNSTFTPLNGVGGNTRFQQLPGEPEIDGNWGLPTISHGIDLFETTDNMIRSILRGEVPDASNADWQMEVRP